MILESIDHPKTALYTISKLATSNYSLREEIIQSPEGYGKNDLIDRGRYCTMDYDMERGPAGAQQGPR
jgi:hypothetical protein